MWCWLAKLGVEGGFIGVLRGHMLYCLKRLISNLIKSQEPHPLEGDGLAYLFGAIAEADASPHLTRLSQERQLLPGYVSSE